MPVLVLNAGSSTLKYRVVGPGTELAAGMVEHIGEPGGPADHAAAVGLALGRVAGHQPQAVGHRVVHGGDELVTPTRVDDEVERAIEKWIPFAPLHNPAALAGIRAARREFSQVPHVAVFDTAFHATMPPAAYTYALDQAVALRHGIRRYGFHGISVRYVRDRMARLLDRDAGRLNLIVLHLGNGASATAVSNGSTVDTSMGMTPLEGLVMGTRTGDLDPAIAFSLIRAGWQPAEVEAMYEHRGGLYGLCGDNDMRTVVGRAGQGDQRAELALGVYCHRLRHYIGAYLAVLGRTDAVVYTAGVGEHSAEVRERVLTGLEPLGIRLDAAANAGGPAERCVSTVDSATQVWVVPTDEEREIARQVAAVLDLPGW